MLVISAIIFKYFELFSINLFSIIILLAINQHTKKIAINPSTILFYEK